jgi:hypothetical protein
MKLLRLSLLVLWLGLGATFAVSQDSVLPKDFGGWHMQGTAKLSADPAHADAANAALLKEYGITGFEATTYSQARLHTKYGEVCGWTLGLSAYRISTSSQHG